MPSKDINADDTDLCILIFHSLVGSDKAVSINLFSYFLI